MPNGKGLELAGHGFTPAVARKITDALAAIGATGKSGEITKVAPVTGMKAKIIIGVGVGNLNKDFDAEALRRAQGNAIRACAGLRKVAVVVSPSVELLRESTVALRLGAYEFTSFKSKGKATLPSSVVMLVPAPVTAEQRASVDEGNVIADSVNLVRDLVNTPPNALPPAALANAAKDAMTGLPVKVTIWDEKALKRDGCGGILAVGQGSANPPRLVKMEYAPKGATARIALVGKGITFDTGGISIKPAANMDEMKSDMAGAAAVIGALQAIARLGLNIAVTGWTAIAENMPGGNAQRPGDVLTTMSGTTVEVLNTDAEGRLVLADALGLAAAEKPDLIVDVATLTGAAVVALGARTSGVMGNVDAVRDEVAAVAGRAGETMWAMPLPEELRATLESPTADIANIGDRAGGMLSAAVFLREFIPTGQPWVHLDIAGPAYNSKAPYGYTPKGGTGAAVRTFVRLAQERAAG